MANSIPMVREPLLQQAYRSSELFEVSIFAFVVIGLCFEALLSLSSDANRSVIQHRWIQEPAIAMDMARTPRIDDSRHHYSPGPWGRNAQAPQLAGLFLRRFVGAAQSSAHRHQSVVRPTIAQNPLAILDTYFGPITVELFLDQAPITVSNFIDLANRSFYDDLHFHRVIPKSMIQFGCPYAKCDKNYVLDESAGIGAPDRFSSFVNLATGEVVTRNEDGKIPDEFEAQIPNKAGTVSMFNFGLPDSGGSQFIINLADNKYLDWFDESTPFRFPVFGKVVDDGWSLDVANKISTVPTETETSERPKFGVQVKSVKIHFPEGLAQQSNEKY